MANTAQVTFDVYTPIPMPWFCLQCKTVVPSEQIQLHPVVYWIASRYWKSPGHPNKTTGAFCSANCASIYG